MDVYSCPKGHQSSEADFCSECGAKITGAHVTTGNGAGLSASACPDCKAPRAMDGGDFCEICGYNFATGVHGDVAFAEATVAAVASAPATVSPTSPAAVPVPESPAPAPDAEITTVAPPKWTLIAVVDPALRESGSPEPPASAGPFTFAIEKPENLIGRHSRARGIEPEVALDFDDAISHRHAIVSRRDDGALSVRDVGSANGTKLNGAELVPLADNDLKEGDQITLGHWTRLTVQTGAVKAGE